MCKSQGEKKAIKLKSQPWLKSPVVFCSVDVEENPKCARCSLTLCTGRKAPCSLTSSLTLPPVSLHFQLRQHIKHIPIRNSAPPGSRSLSGMLLLEACVWLAAFPHLGGCSHTASSGRLLTILSRLDLACPTPQRLHRCPRSFFFIAFILLSPSFADLCPCLLWVCPSPGYSKPRRMKNIPPLLWSG